MVVFSIFPAKVCVVLPKVKKDDSTLQVHNSQIRFPCDIEVKIYL